ncbi:uncharacterized protein LOC143424865 [Xylocopa sonorina]|uniref:uncharacterized protein LOC143424865 n=1 Tax=Xylocopa sonorina TaxID=1818115 RepID=UPI00403B0660
MKGRVTTPRGAWLSLLAAYLAAFLATVCEGGCPTGCECHFDEQPRSVTCTNLDLDVFPEIYNISGLVEHLNLCNNQLTNLTDDINRLTELQFLNLTRNKLSSLPNDFSLENLRRLDLSGNKILNVVDINSVEQLPKLKILHLSRNPLNSLEGLISDTLEAVDASYCEIRELSNTSLDGLPKLLMLSLAGNPLQVIHKPWSPNLRWLDMSDCTLNFLTPDTFSGFPELKDLKMSNNPMLVYSTRYSTLMHLKLRTLDVSKCNLDRPGLHGFPSLTSARLSRNSIRILPDRIFAKNRELGFLYLDGNDIEVLSANAFEGLVRLQVLDLSDNKLEAINPLGFHENVELKLLNLSHNMLDDLPSLTTAVITLDVSFNMISNLNGDFLANMPSIRSVILSDNRLLSIPSGLKSTTLKNFDLRRNRIGDVRNDTFLRLPQLRRIDLSGNRLTEAIDPLIFRNNPELNTIKLGDNPWRCDCNELYIMHIYLTESPAKTSHSSLICQTPMNVSGYTWETACSDVWNQPLHINKDRTWAIVMIIVLTSFVLFGSFVSIRHMMKMKRRAFEQRQQIESSALLRHRRYKIHVVPEEQPRVERPPEPRIHPLELVGPPSYEEAIQMPRLARSLDNLDEISVDTTPVRVLGSADNLRTKQRRTRRPKKRVQSEDDLLRREDRRRERLRRERNVSVGSNATDLPQGQRNARSAAARRLRRHSMMSDSVDSSGGRIQPRPQTPSAKKRKRRYTVYDGHSTDDEDSDVQPVGSSRSIVIRELRREPKGGYRESATERDS